MPGSSEHERGDTLAYLHCSECGARLAHDQRYCVECGARRGGLPGPIAERIHTMLAPGGGVVAPLGLVAAEPLGAAELAAPSTMISRSMPSPRASAVAIMAMLAFGVVVGSFASSAAETPGAVYFASLPPAAATTPAAPVTTPPASGGGGSPSSPSSGGSSSAAAAGGSGSSGGGGGGGGGGGSTPSTLPPVKHLFVIMLSDHRYDQTFGAPASDPYLAKTLRKQGELLQNYYAVAQGDLANEIALISGQGPTPQTATNCPQFMDIKPGKTGAEGEVLGSGCLYPKTTLTLADQLTAAGKTWKAYVEDIGNGPHGQPATCRHPALGSADSGQSASRHDPYVTWSNPFVYFHSIGKAACAKDDVGLNRLAVDLKSATTTPTLSYIVASPCDDGSDQPCIPGAKSSGLAAADKFLRTVVPEIERSAAYKADGMIAITFDQAPQTGPYADASSCCNNPTQYPNLPTVATPTTTTTTPTTTTTTPTTPSTTTPAPTVTIGTNPNPTYSIPITTPTTPTTTTPTTTTPTTTTPTIPTPTSELSGQTTPTGGGGEVGLLLISKYVKPNSLDSLAYFNHYSLLSSIEQLFGLKRLGYARDPALPALGKPQYNHYP